MREPVAVMTMVKDDHFFLEKWVRYYGDLFGRSSLYILSHGGEPEIARIGEGCNIIRMPGGYEADFNTKRARIFSGFGSGLTAWFDFVIITDVDEFIILDPASGMTLPEFLAKRKNGQVLTPIGVEVVHRPEEEKDSIRDRILGPRSYARYSSFYCKPVIMGRPTKLSRGNHYSDCNQLKTFRNLYLFHMKYCDRGMSLDLLKARGKIIENVAANHAKGEAGVRPTTWNKYSGKEIEHLEALSNLPVESTWDFSGHSKTMHETWGPRGGELFDFKRHEGKVLYKIPERFFGIV